MAVSDLQQAERASRTRGLMMALMGVVLVIHSLDALFGADASTMTPWFRHGLWGGMIVLWLSVLATGGWLRLGRRARSLLNDEFALINRSRALQAGFWTATAMGLALYFASLQWVMSTREVLLVLVDVAVAAALLRYAWLELR